MNSNALYQTNVIDLILSFIKFICLNKNKKLKLIYTTLAMKTTAHPLTIFRPVTPIPNSSTPLPVNFLNSLIGATKKLFNQQTFPLYPKTRQAKFEKESKRWT